jgi:hypothetical protein
MLRSPLKNEKYQPVDFPSVIIFLDKVKKKKKKKIISEKFFFPPVCGRIPSVDPRCVGKMFALRFVT